MVTIAPLIFCFLLGLLLLFFLGQYASQWIYGYRITDSHIEILTFGLPLFKIAVTDILEVRKVSFRELLPWKNRESISWCQFRNRFFGESILILRRTGLFKGFVITPNDPQDFLQTLNQRLTNLPAPRCS